MWRHLWVGGKANPPPPEFVLMRLVERFGAEVLFLPQDLVNYFINMLDVERLVEKQKTDNSGRRGRG